MTDPHASLARAELVREGAHHNAHALVQQAGYTLGIASAEGPALVNLLPDPHYLATIETLRAEVESARRDKTNAAAEAAHASSLQGEALRTLRVWRRRLAKRAARARRLGHDVPEALALVGPARALNDVLDRVHDTLALARTHVAALSAAGGNAQTLIDQGSALYDQLKSANTVEQLKRLSELPASVQAFFAKKGELYIALKVVNDAAHELHADDPANAARFNLRILNSRHAARSAAAPTPTGTPPAGSGNH